MRKTSHGAVPGVSQRTASQHLQSAELEESSRKGQGWGEDSEGPWRDLGFGCAERGDEKALKQGHFMPVESRLQGARKGGGLVMHAGGGLSIDSSCALETACHPLCIL